ncbi:hypothetical protein [Pseudonocardia pini]|uniref:hypothetical protein n=1 Tax=Pseudonocardia pini TaxID=2758030 RepID=UPI0015F0FAD5|nr:hypothetical protein [Pseudonocardia pini]
MLKKAGIITAGVAASLVAVSPLAFAGEGHHEKHSSSPKNVGVISDGGSSSANGLVAVNALNDAEILKNVNVCGVDVDAVVGILGVLSPAAVGDAAPNITDCSGTGDSAGIFQD